LAAKGLKEKAVSGIFWSFSDSMATQLSQFIAGLILARILSPDEFGLVGMITVFVAISQSLSDGGFGDALIRKKDVSDADYSTAFYFNLIASVAIFAVLYFTAPAVARFYAQPELVDIERVLGITILINALCIVQRTQLTIKVNFKMHMKVNLVASVISGVIAIIMALTGFGVWALVWRSIIRSVVNTIMLWTTNKWKPLTVFSRESFRSLFSFGSRVIISNLIDTVYNNVFLLIIGKFYSPAQLGYYTRADQFSRLASRNLAGTVQRVSYPVLSQVQDENEKLREGYRKIIMAVMFVTFTVMLGMAAISEAMIVTLIGEKWLPSVEFLQLLCLAAMLYPLHALNINILNIKGRSDIMLRLEIIKKLLAVPIIIVGVLIGIRALLLGIVLHSFISYFINAFYSGKQIDYKTRDQIKDILPAFFVALFTSLLVFAVKFIPGLPQIVILIVQVTVLLVVTVSLAKRFRLQGYAEIRNIISDRLPSLGRFL